MPEKHALLGASSAHRWLHCPPSARLEAELPDTAGEAAREGTLAHAVAELKLWRKFVEPMSQKTFTTRMNKLKKHELYQDEMQVHTDVYIDYLTECAMQYPHTPTVAAEVRVDYSDWAPEGFGTADCIMIGGDVLRITDFKYGKGVPVAAENNAQMRLYALGALGLYRAIYPVKTIRMAIVQPRLGSISEDEMTADDLLRWAEETVKPAAALAYAGLGDYCAGDWCRFCRARAQCRAHAAANTSVIDDFGEPPKQPPLLSNAEIGQALARAEPFIRWFSDLKDYALSAVLRGEDVPGWKAVAGRSTRSFSDPDAAFAALRAGGVDEAMLYERKPLTLAQVEKVIGKADLQQFAGAYIIKPAGKPTLAPESDSRPAYDGAAADFAGLGGGDGA